ncbi:MAG: OadG family protein [Terrisporobacter sp.]|uniref:OadG family protein n=1 Tax=Paraclostridium sp. TaxID=2023273 RepID=UPI003AA79478
MNISQLLEALKDPSAVLSLGEKLLAGVSVAILSMGVVFIVLVVIALIIAILQKDRSDKNKEVSATTNIKELSNELIEESSNDNTEELVSVITAAIAAATGNSINNIIVRKIERSNNNKTSWERMAKNTTK